MSSGVPWYLRTNAFMNTHEDTSLGNLVYQSALMRNPNPSVSSRNPNPSVSSRNPIPSYPSLFLPSLEEAHASLARNRLMVPDNRPMVMASMSVGARSRPISSSSTSSSYRPTSQQSFGITSAFPPGRNRFGLGTQRMGPPVRYGTSSRPTSASSTSSSYRPTSALSATMMRAPVHGTSSTSSSSSSSRPTTTTTTTTTTSRARNINTILRDLGFTEKLSKFPLRKGDDLEMDKKDLETNTISMSDFEDGDKVIVVYTQDQIKALGQGETVNPVPAMIYRLNNEGEEDSDIKEYLAKYNTNPLTREKIFAVEKRTLRFRTPVPVPAPSPPSSPSSSSSFMNRLRLSTPIGSSSSSNYNERQRRMFEIYKQEKDNAELARRLAREQGGSRRKKQTRKLKKKGKKTRKQ